MNAELAIPVAGIVAHLFGEPIGTNEILVRILEFDFGDHQAGVAALENIDLEARVPFGPAVARLLDHPFTAECEQRLPIGAGDGVLVFLPGNPEGRTLDREPGRIFADADANHRLRTPGEIALPKGRARGQGLPLTRNLRSISIAVSPSDKTPAASPKPGARV